MSHLRRWSTYDQVALAVWAGVACSLLLVWWQFGLYAAAALKYPFGLDYSEGLIWQQALWVGGPHMYGPLNGFPFLVYEYPPLFLLVHRCVALSGIGMLAAGRLISVLSTLAACGLIGGVVWLAGRALVGSSRRIQAASIVAGGLPIVLLPIVSWAVLLRVDMLALALSYGGIALGLAALRRPALLTPAVLCFVAAVFTKQIYIAAAVSLGLVWLVRDPRRCMIAYGIGGAAGFALALALNLATQGGFMRHIFGVYYHNVSRLDFAEAWHQSAIWLAATPALPALVTAGVGIAWWQNTRPAPAKGRFEGCATLAFLTVYLALTTLMLVSAGKVGASRNYFIEWMACWCVWIGVLACLCLSALGTARAGSLARLAMALLLLVQVTPIPSALAILRKLQFSPAHYADAAALLARIKKLSGLILSDDMTAVIQSGREVVLEPGILAEMAQSGQYDTQALVNMLRNHTFAAVITAYDPGDRTFDQRYLPETQSALLAAYPVVERYGYYRLRLPR